MPWFAADGITGLPYHDHTLFAARQNDLAAALSHSLVLYNAVEGETCSFTFGAVTVTYTCINPMQGQGSGCVWNVRYSSDNDEILWLHMIWHRTSRTLTYEPIFTVWPA